jgi:hypothetical protein
MDFAKILNFALLSCGLVGILMLMMTVLAFLKGRHKIGNRTGVLIIVFVLLGTMIALSVGDF